MSQHGVQSETKPNRNRFNRLTSKEWLPFQKSWFRFQGYEKLYRENIRFFVPAAQPDTTVYYYGSRSDIAQQIATEEQLTVTADLSQQAHFALLDLSGHPALNSLENYEQLRDNIIQIASDLYRSLVHRRFMAVLIPNVQAGGTYFPFAWDIAKHLSTIFSLKDEKICCLEESVASDDTFFTPSKGQFYCLYFRKDEHSAGKYSPLHSNYFRNNRQPAGSFANEIPSWFILKPPPRNKSEVLHPAKYPERLPEMFIHEFTKAGDVVFDPMSGTGSTQLAALRLNRNAYGTELSHFFSGIAIQRCTDYLQKEQKQLQFKIVNADARTLKQHKVPAIDYMITSPPYWDMLNMKGAEYQAKRVEKGLQLNYSDDHEDLGNITDYQSFIQELCSIYFSIAEVMKPGSYFTIVVKNIKKKGHNYPFAWDIANELQRKFILLPEVFWCQDDISIAPFGYGNTWVSNTFHQYCLTFQLPHS